MVLIIKNWYTGTHAKSKQAIYEYEMSSCRKWQSEKRKRREREGARKRAKTEERK